MKVLVTGGAGYIGSHLSEELLKRGHSVTVLDNFSRGDVQNLSAIHEHPNLEVITGDILDKSLVNRLVVRNDMVFHLAAIVGVKHYVENPQQVIETNVFGTSHVLESAYQAKTKVVFASTSEVYGKSASVPFQEHGDRVLGATCVDRWSYSTSKALDEHLSFAYHRKGLPITIIRYFNSYGPRADVSEYGGVVIRFILQALRGEPITVHNDGSQTRSFTYVSDTVKGTVLAGESKNTSGQIYNIGNDQEINILHLAKKIKEISNSSSPIVFIPYEGFYGSHYEDIKRRVPNIEAARNTLGWMPIVGLNEGLRNCLLHYADHN